ncbi:MAG: hypothetical protein ACXVUL_10780 [Solirubrobacteraceae bacterium]
MWLYILALFLLVFGIVGSVLSGGIFTIVFIPLGVIAVISAVAFGAFGRGAHGRHGASTNARPSTGRPLPASEHSNTAQQPSTPEQLAEARRLQQ